MQAHIEPQRLEIVRIAFIGLGERGLKALRLMSPTEGVAVTALCDLSMNHVHEALAQLAASKDTASILVAAGADAYHDICQSANVDLVYICSDWQSHTNIAVTALEAGKHVAVEVPAAMTLEDIYRLRTAASASGKQCFLLENVCFDLQVRDAIRTIRQGQIGEVVHAEGSYYHHLDDRWTAWRLNMNRRTRGDLYPTHELGPICQALDIGRTDRLQTLVSMDSAAFSGAGVYKDFMHQEAPDFKNGDHTTTLIRTSRGRTILLKHNVITPQPYERRLVFIGTRGRIELNDAGKASHEEMTKAMNHHLIDCLLRGASPSISIADLATWCAAIPLSKDSIERGFAPVPYPDFYS